MSGEALPVPVVLVTAVHPAHGVILSRQHILLEQLLKIGGLEGGGELNKTPFVSRNIFHHASN